MRDGGNATISSTVMNSLAGSTYHFNDCCVNSIMFMLFICEISLPCMELNTSSGYVSQKLFGIIICNQYPISVFVGVNC